MSSEKGNDTNKEHREQNNTRDLESVELNLGLILHQNEDDDEADEEEDVEDQEQQRVIPGT